MATTSAYPGPELSTTSSRLSTDSHRTSNSMSTLSSIRSHSDPSLSFPSAYCPSHPHQHYHHAHASSQSSQQPRYSHTHATRRHKDHNGMHYDPSVPNGLDEIGQEKGVPMDERLDERVDGLEMGVGDFREAAMGADPQTRLRKRDYAVEISRIMGRQLVDAMNKGKKRSGLGHDEEVGEDG